MTASRRTKRPTLARALAYRNDQIVYKFTTKWRVSSEEAQELFTETKRLLWVMHACRARGHTFQISPALSILDEMWHTFVLFTRQYTTYCERVFGSYMHHQPTTRADQQKLMAQLRRDPARFAARRTRQDVRQWQLVQELCGDETLLKWYVELPTRYPRRFFKTKMIPIEMSWRPPRSLIALARERS